MEKISIRKATISDLPTVLHLLSDDPLGSTREQSRHPLPLFYRQAFERIKKQSGNDIYVALLKDEIVGCMQLTMIAGLSRKGVTRMQIESVRVSSKLRSSGIGKQMMKYAIELAKTSGCGLVQLTTDKSRTDAHRFYERLGFTASHEGMKLDLFKD
ncbi:GNAT family N-acetyltransferase [Sneathiella glossodoripedis]|uniref:GNAT family N-acetyltransferase n=1 Tax=Sneathiella glossodoripedis TaxID=418853 RepID=UPI000685CC34|nr:GNAT family N-acetyltransferase [Sneathiella glossodoripedis]